MLSREEAKKLAEQVLSYSRFPECQVEIGASEDTWVRFANNGLTTSGLVRRQDIFISSTKDRKTGNTSVNQLDEKSLRDAVARSEQMAEIALPNEEHVPSLAPQKYPDIDRTDPATAGARSPQLITHARTVVEAARAKNLVAAGFVERTTSCSAIAAKTGLFGYQTVADASLTATVRTPAGDGSGWAAQPSLRFADIDSAGVARTAVEKCLSTRGAKRVEPGKYTVVMEPAAAGALLQDIEFAMNA